MNSSALVLWGSLSALALTLSAGACGGRAEIGPPKDSGDDGGGSDSSSGAAGSSSGFSGSSSGFSGSSSGFSGSSSGIDGGGSGSSSGFSGSSSGFSGSSSGISGSSSGISGSSSGVSGSSSGSSSSSGGPNGSIYLEECTAPFCAGQAFYATASFYTTEQGTGGCTVTNAGACAYYACSTTTQQNGVGAGTITISGPWLTTPVMMTASSPTNTYQYTSSSPGYTAGQTLTVTASGGTVPPFGPETVVAPEQAQITSPAIVTDGGTTTISTATDLQITWDGGQPGATMLLEAYGSGGTSYTYCTWSASDGQATIPASVLQPFSGQSGYFIYGQYNATTFFAGPYDVSVTALPYTGGVISFQ